MFSLPLIWYLRNVNNILAMVLKRNVLASPVKRMMAKLPSLEPK
uniref:Uncharacterized protein n=1 Tax=Rhizophora mucronata TaxID=61149 RepID=A0A2P2P6R1_RHIMU